MSQTVDQPENPESPTGLSRRHILMGGAMLAVAGAAYARMPKRRFQNIDDKTFEAMFPKNFGKWHTLPSSELIMPPEGDLTAKLYQHILTRTYVNDAGQGVMFLVAYNSEQVNNVQVHRPEICYKASGFDIQDSKPYDIQVSKDQVIPARLVRAERVSRAENIIYWTRIGDDFPQSWTQQRIAMTKANLEGFYADGLLVRASVIDNDESKSIAVLSSFLQELVQNSPPQARYIAFRA
ncbi:MAG: EpsI family protein [Sphingobium sp.]|nr:EpsI family protein [Sphingobium sp.]